MSRSGKVQTQNWLRDVHLTARETLMESVAGLQKSNKASSSTCQGSDPPSPRTSVPKINTARPYPFHSFSGSSTGLKPLVYSALPAPPNLTTTTTTPAVLSSSAPHPGPEAEACVGVTELTGLSGLCLPRRLSPFPLFGCRHYSCCVS